MTQVANGFSHIVGDIALAKSLMKDILPENFSDESNANPFSETTLRINPENLFNYYYKYYETLYLAQI